jgi:murein tripeptide amidase MpaA
LKPLQFCLIASIVAVQSCAVKNNHSSVQNRSLVKIDLQDRKVFAFDKQGVYFSNQFASARINQLAMLNDSTFNVTVEPENEPINQSAWYAFKVWGKNGKNVYVNLVYPKSKHRYQPKLSYNGKTWQTLDKIVLNKEKNEASFKIQLSKDTLTVAAQEIISSTQSYEWMDDLVKTYALNKTVIGESIGGKPIIALNSTKSDGKKIVVVLSRQHPPEISGYMAMVQFVETLLGKTDLAKKFIEGYELIVIPMINPDGVDEGNWRHSFAGVDLNRDWIDFKQPETRAVRDFLLEKVNKQKAKVYFALDFHSTFNDVLYTNEDRADTNFPGLTSAWIKGLHEFEGSNKTTVKPSGNGGNVSKAWLGKVLNAEALTYEVGDQTPRPYIKQKATKVAEVLMTQLLGSDK